MTELICVLLDRPEQYKVEINRVNVSVERGQYMDYWTTEQSGNISLQIAMYFN